MSTLANVKQSDSSHWYYQDGRPCYEMAKKDGSGMRPTTLADARKLNLLPSVTTILRILEKPALTDWKIEQAVLAAMTTPRLDGEADDAFVYRVLHQERHQDQESQKARDRGTEIHDALESLWNHDPVSDEIKPWIMPAFEALSRYGAMIETEKALTGEGYAGKTDLVMLDSPVYWLFDYKTSKKLPDPKKGAYAEHRLQLGAYARAWNKFLSGTGPDGPELSSDTEIRTANLYISTVDPGAFVICEHGPWQEQYRAFSHLVAYWQIANQYFPKP